MKSRARFSIAQTFATLSFSIAVAGPTLAAEPVTVCGQVLTDGGFLTGDLDCSAHTGSPALTIEAGTLELGGFMFTGNETGDSPFIFADPGISCPGKCAIVGPGVVTGGPEAVIHGSVRVTLDGVTMTNAGLNAYYGVVVGDDKGGGTAVIRDSTIEGQPNTGVQAERKVIVERSTIRDSGTIAIGAGQPRTKFLVRDSIISGNGFITFSPAIRGGRIRLLDSEVTDNFGMGVDADGTLTISGSLVSGNARSGVRTEARASIRQSEISGNCVSPNSSGCSDVNSCVRPAATDVICETSSGCSGENPTWGICALD